MAWPLLRSSSCGKVGSALSVLVLLLSASFALLGQEKLLAPVKYGTVNVVDLATLTTDQVMTVGALQTFVLVGANPRLAFVGAEFYLSVIDFSLGREVGRIYGVCPFYPAALTSDRKYLLVEDDCGYGNYEGLTVVNANTGKVVRRVNLARVLGQGAYQGYVGPVVVTGKKAYVAAVYGDPVLSPLAVLDLRTFRLRPVNVPAGSNDFNPLWAPNAAVTPDQKYVVMVEDLQSDGSSHLYVISTANDQVVLDQPLNNFDPVGIVITPVNTAGKVYGYLLAADYNNNGLLSATVVDLNEGSKTFGQLLPQTEVLLNPYFSPYQVSAAVINSDGRRLVVGGYKASKTNSPNPNVVELDTGLMLTNPSQAIVGSASVGSGNRPRQLTTATISTTLPPTAPTVTKVSPASITNDTENTLTITGTNFASNAVVRIGTFPPLPATVSGSTSLHVTVPKHWPAQANIDVQVTNPQTNGIPSQQYQSGVLPDSLTIYPNPQFQPKNRFASYNFNTWSVSVYEPGQQTMINVPNSIVPYGIAFSTDGAGIYAPGYSSQWGSSTQVTEWNPLDDSVKGQIPISGVVGFAQQIGELAIAPSVDPKSGDPVVFVPVYTYSSGKWDIGVQMVDTKTNTVSKILAAGLNLSSNPNLYGAVATPNGQYVYVNYFNNNGEGYIVVFDVLHGTATSLNTQTLGVSYYQSEMTVSPDGQSLLLQGVYANGASPIQVFDISINPTNPTLVTTITGTPPPGSPAFSFYSWKVAAGRLFALGSTQNAIVAFNFDRAHSDFGQLNYSLAPLQYFLENLAVSPDGSLLYIPVGNYDFIAVLDANALINGQDPYITSIGGFIFPLQVTVSPVTQQSRPAADWNTNGASNPAGRTTSGARSSPVSGEHQQSASELRGRGAYDVQ